MMQPLTAEQVHHRDQGDGAPVVFVHGLAEDHRSWSPQFAGPDALRGARLIALDVRGHGRTPVGDGDGTVEQLADDLGSVLRTLTGPATVVGFSLGGVIALEAARRHPELVTDLVVVATSSVVGGRARGFFEERIALVESGHLDELREALGEDTRHQLHSDEVDLPALVSRRVEAIGDGRGYLNAARAMVGLADRPLTPHLSEIDHPVRVVGASDDLFCPRKAAQMLLDGLPNATYDEIDGAGHLINVERPDALSRLIQKAIDDKVHT